MIRSLKIGSPDYKPLLIPTRSRFFKIEEMNEENEEIDNYHHYPYLCFFFRSAVTLIAFSTTE